jgi:hypothetical protein
VYVLAELEYTAAKHTRQVAKQGLVVLEAAVVALFDSMVCSELTLQLLLAVSSWETDVVKFYSSKVS